MNPAARDPQAAGEVQLTPAQEAAVRAAGVWVNMMARTFKTCRLYDANNPTVIRFRSELSVALVRLLAEHGPLRLRFSSDDVLCEGVSLYPARSRDDNLALGFFRDGVRGLTFNPGVEAHELESLIDMVMRVTGRDQVEDDLVTLLWEAALPHVDVDYVPSEGDVGGADAAQIAAGADSGPVLPWPTTGGDEGAVEVEAAGGGSDTDGTTAGDPARTGRSDDWSAGESTVEIEAGFEELESLSSSEIERFRAEYDEERTIPLVAASVAIAQAYLAAGANDDDRVELARFLPRVLRQAVTHGQWLEARETLRLLRTCGSAEWSLDTFAQELLQPISIAGVIERLDQQEGPAVVHFTLLARELGDPGVDWLNLVLADSQDRKNRRMLAEAIANLCRENPERLAPWISDPRWYVVRNVVHILGWIGGPRTVTLLQAALRHPDPRVKQEVVAALASIDPKLARPLLVRLLDGADTRLFCAVLHQLSSVRDAVLAKKLLGYIQDPVFDTRPTDEKHAIYSALSGVGGDEIVPDLEAELHKGNWFARNQEVHRQAVARTLARIGTPLARAAVGRGLQSKRGPVRKACEDAAGGMRDAA